MHWFAIAWSGFVATLIASAFFWLLRSFGWTRFSPSVQVGCIFLRNPSSPVTETLGFVILLLLGSTLVPAAYAKLFQLWTGPSWSTGALVGVVHGILAAALIPALGMISACVRSGATPAPGRLGLAWGRATPAGVVVGHLVYGGIAGAILAGF